MLTSCGSAQTKICQGEDKEAGVTHIRASIDMRIPNKAMKRSRCMQAPIIDDCTYTLKDCVIFSKLDLRQGYHQLAIDKESSKVATSSTPWGNFRPNLLVCGAKSSQDLFDEVMYHIFGGTEQCKNQRDEHIWQPV